MSLGLYKEQVQMRFGLGTGSGGEALGVSRYDKYAKNGLSINMAVKEGGTHSLFINGANVLSESGKKNRLREYHRKCISEREYPPEPITILKGK